MGMRAIVVAVFLLLCMATVVDGWRRWHYTTPEPSTLSSRWRALEQKVQHLRNRGYWMQRSSKYITRQQSSMMQELTGSVANMSEALSEEMRLMKEIGRENAHEYEEITDELRRQQRRVQSQIQGLWSAVGRLGGGTPEPPFQRTTDAPTRTCRSHQFKCTHRNKCVPRSYLCDRDNDCGDWSDEQPHNCPDRTTPQPWRPESTESPWEPRSTAGPCPPHKFSCDNGRRCIRSSWLCDDYGDCRDGSDELYENCRRLNATIHPHYTGGPQPTHGPWKPQSTESPWKPWKPRSTMSPWRPWKPRLTAEPQTTFYWNDEPSDMVKEIKESVEDLVTKKK